MYFEVLRDFQVAVGLGMMLLSVVQLLHTQCRFVDLTEADRENFAAC